ncbi:unnamed protein product [Blepharisma stoltei]|uniref:Uncharacterized protein n=1 Tax=Blepharisma stoltei TaxID=1481888 RepID=A0AAU9JWA7_9CILI|nr:unnamed protein product [Blepharisma stoltei]
MARSLSCFFLSLFTLIHFAWGCFKYTCKTSEQAFLPETCIYNDNLTDTYYSRKCSDSKYQCFPDQASSYQLNYSCSLPTSQTYSNYPGVFCKTSDDCSYSLPCKDGVCVGTPKGGECTAGGMFRNLLQKQHLRSTNQNWWEWLHKR